MQKHHILLPMQRNDFVIRLLLCLVQRLNLIEMRFSSFVESSHLMLKRLQEFSLDEISIGTHRAPALVQKLLTGRRERGQPSMEIFAGATLSCHAEKTLEQFQLCGCLFQRFRYLADG